MPTCTSGATPDAGRPWARDRVRAQKKTFQAAVRAARDKKADLLLIAGDLFHRPPLTEDLQEVDSVFSQLTRTKVILIAGNHDFLQPDCPLLTYQWQSDVTLLTDPEAAYFSDLNATIYGFSYDRRELPDSFLNELHPHDTDGLHILLTHGGDATHLPYDEKRLAASGFDYIALGHIHIPKIGPGPLGNPGSLEPLDRTELGPHGFLEVDLSEQGADIQFVPAAHYQYHLLPLTLEPDTTQFLLEQKARAAIDDFVQNQPPEGPSPIFLLQLQGTRDPRLTIDKEALAELGPIAEVLDETAAAYDLTQLYEEHRQDMLGMYIQALEGDTDPVSQKALELGIRALLDAQTP